MFHRIIKGVIVCTLIVGLFSASAGRAYAATSGDGGTAAQKCADELFSKGLGGIFIGIFVCSAIAIAEGCKEYYDISDTDFAKLTDVNTGEDAKVTVTISGAQKSISRNEFVQSCGVDADKDSIFDVIDNCLDKKNADQLDYDKDGEGNACDTTPGCPDGKVDVDGACKGDADKDGDADDADNCPGEYNPGQKDWDKDGKGNVCDDTPCPDGEMYIEDDDDCVEDPNYDPGDDDDDDDAFDLDVDGVPDELDNCPEDANPDQKDSDKDGVGDICVDKYLTSGESSGKCSLSLAGVRSPAAGLVILLAAFGIILTARFRKE